MRHRKRDLARAPVFPVMLALQNTPAPALSLGGVTLEGVDLDLGSAKFDLSLSLTERFGGLSGVFEYNADLFDAETIDRMSAHLATLLVAPSIAKPQ